MNQQDIDRLAAGVHQAFCLKNARWQSKIAEMTFAELSEDLKEENRRNARDILNKLNKKGFTVQRKTGDLQGDTFTLEEIDALSQDEHMRWMKSKINLGYKYGEVRDDTKKTHTCLKPWRKLSDEELIRLDPLMREAILNEELPQEEKDKDIELVIAIPVILDIAGLVMVRL